GSPQLILMDLSLPVIDGLAATRLIRKLPEFESVPIIAVSAHDTSDFQSEAIEAGCNSYVTKPIDFNELEDLIAQFLKKQLPILLCFLCLFVAQFFSLWRLQIDGSNRPRRTEP